MTQAFRNSGFQSGTVSVSYFRRLSDILSDDEALLLALIPLLQLCKRAARPGSPRGSESLYHEELGPGRRCIIGHWTSCNRLFLLPPVQTITWGNITVLVPVTALVLAETVICTGKKNTQTLLKSVHENTKSTLFHCSHSPLSVCLTDLKIGNGHICTGE